MHRDTSSHRGYYRKTTDLLKWTRQPRERKQHFDEKLHHPKQLVLIRVQVHETRVIYFMMLCGSYLIL